MSVQGRVCGPGESSACHIQMLLPCSQNLCVELSLGAELSGEPRQGQRSSSAMPSTPSEYKFVKPLDALSAKEAENVLALEQQLRNVEDQGPDPPPMGLSAEEQTAYPSISARANSSFLTGILLIGTLSPVILNNLWLMTANVVNKGGGHQDFWWFTLVFDNYFMIVKGIMFSAFFYAFLPEPRAGTRVKTRVVQYAKDERFFAFKRFVVIIVIMVADVIFISSSHLVLLMFKAFRDGDFGRVDPLARALVELAFLVGFVQGECHAFVPAEIARIASSRAYEICAFLAGLLADFLELPRVLTSIFTWTIDLHYPKQSGSIKFCFAETQVKFINVPTDFGEDFRQWANETARDRKENRFILHQGEQAHSSFDTVWEGFRDPGLFSFYQFMTVQLGGIMFCRYRARIIIKIASSVMLIAVGTLIRVTPSKDVLNRVRDHTQPRELMQWILPAAMCGCDKESCDSDRLVDVYFKSSNHGSSTFPCPEDFVDVKGSKWDY
eukprot:Skav220714  [mRNA]  locus=scaffold1850:53263:58042:- [translate_table: standard]